MLTQFSVHHRESISSDLTHSEYLADAANTCERAVALALIKALGDRGSIVVYSSFEKTRIMALKEALPDLASALHAILNRLVDFLSMDVLQTVFRRTDTL